MREFLNITKALADETRLRIILALRNRELCVCQIITFLGLAPSTVSEHLSMLTKAGLIEKRKSGKWAFYRLTSENGSHEIKVALSWVCKTLAEKRKIREDFSQLKKILGQSLDEICCEVKKKSEAGRS
ncbi:MAG: metalloregulator ArsR/SmtB family transcription factor [Candidatus Riflebacteria bacterium]|nr:metalloregulator ArsR/SmtB family transcription factor [Candidatus Riflebacteria bacterium]